MINISVNINILQLCKLFFLRFSEKKTRQNLLPLTLTNFLILLNYGRIVVIIFYLKKNEFVLYLVTKNIFVKKITPIMNYLSLKKQIDH